ncbi:unnamed protein product [Adineta steineri]|uniref:Uncharacterized protein n=1 Tax=Adineta steineri TaxID=433720 RepID=A0A818T6C9_9BILA|nr:unnamed protein product [Adineta steineri]
MASASNKVPNSTDGNLETYSLIWLDGKVNKTEENLKTQQKLRQIINHLKTFTDKEQCQEYISSVSQQDRLVIIVSGHFGRQLVPIIHPLRQVSSIYVYCMDKKANEQWANEFNKVKGVITRLKDLITQIGLDHKNRIKSEKPLVISIYKINDNLNELNNQFIYSYLLIDLLLRMKSVETNKQALIDICKEQFPNNFAQLNLIEEFKENYKKDKAIWWYTRNSFLNQILNKALITQNIDLLFLFRSIIYDICEQLRQYQIKLPIQVYRSQMMSTHELNNLQQSIGDFISMNSFISTCIQKQKASQFSNISNDLHRVLFIIDADPNVVISKPFADVSQFTDDYEILFMIGSIFRINHIHQDLDEQIWVIQMSLCGDNEKQLKDVFDRMKKNYGGDGKEVSLRSFGDLLRDMGKLDLAEKMYSRLLSELPSNDASLPDLYNSFGVLSKEKRDYNTSLQWYNKALEMNTKINSSDYVKIGSLYNSIGEVHWKKYDPVNSVKYYKKAIEHFRQARDENHSSLGEFYNNIATVYQREKKFAKSLKYYKNSLVIQEKHLPSNHVDIATCYNNIGSAHFGLEDYKLAQEYYNKSLEIRLKSLPAQHPDIAMSYKNIGAIYEKKSEWQQALTYYEKAATIYRNSLPLPISNVIKIKEDIDRVSSKLK